MFQARTARRATPWAAAAAKANSSTGPLSRSSCTPTTTSSRDCPASSGRGLRTRTTGEDACRSTCSPTEPSR